MKEITEYRKVSAEWMGYTDMEEINGNLVLEHKDGQCEYWQPDQDLNQMGMIIDRLREQGINVNMRLKASIPNSIYPSNITLKRDFVIYKEGEEKPEYLVMKAFMQYLKSK